jgi:predicted RNA-binding protein with PUA-like domain
MRQMAVGDQVLIYHSSCKDIGVVGIVKVVRTAYPDPSQFDENSIYFDPKSKAENPRWDAVDLVFVRKLPRLIALEELKLLSRLSDLALIKRGNRLSVMPVSESEWNTIVSLS